MHRTESLDFGIIMQGSIVLELEGGETTTLKQGDVIVQRGTIHSWKNPSAEDWTRIYWVVIGEFCTRVHVRQKLIQGNVTGAKPVEVNGQVLGQDWSRAVLPPSQ